jgi:LPS sulfotransferase NodH
MMKNLLVEPYKYWIKASLAACVITGRPWQRPILIISTRRSGSTLLLELLYTQDGMTYSDQPLDAYHYSPTHDKLPQAYLSQFMHPTQAQEQQLTHFFSALFAGRRQRNAPWNWFHPHHRWVVNRLVVKEVNSHSLIDWFAAHFAVDIIFLVRHPIANALSLVERRWGYLAEAFLQNDAFCAAHLTAAQKNECLSVLARGTALQKYALEWGLANRYPLAVCRERTWLTLTYEELLMRPQAIVALLAERFALSAPERMVQQLRQPSKNSIGASRALIQYKQPQHLLARWTEQVTPAEADEVMDLLTGVLGISAYRADSPYPVASLCHFGALDSTTEEKRS